MDMNRDSTNIFLYHIQGIDKFEIQSELINSLIDEQFITDFKLDSKDRIWYTSSVSGTVNCFERGEVTKTYNLNKLGVGSTVRSINIVNDTLWLATENGALCLHPDSGYSAVLSQAHGLLSSDVRKVLPLKNLVYIATSKGLQVVDKEIMENIKHPELNCFITSVKINESLLDKNSKSSLAHHRNNLFIKFYSNAHNTLGKYDFKYRLLGVDSEKILLPVMLRNSIS